MKLTVKPKCTDCPEENPRNLIKCIRSTINGCGNYYCLLLHWPDHAKKHQEEWAAMTEDERQEAMSEYDEGKYRDVD